MVFYQIGGHISEWLYSCIWCDEDIESKDLFIDKDGETYHESCYIDKQDDLSWDAEPYLDS